MTAPDLLAVFAYVCLTGLVGYAALAVLRADRLIRNWAAAYLAGQLCWLLCFLVGGWSGVSAPTALLAVTVGLGPLGAVLLVKRAPRPTWHGGGRALLGGVLFLAVYPNLVAEVLRLPLVGWDARSIWFFHGKAIWAHRGVTGAFFAHPAYAWSHPDYPLLIPSQAVVVAFLRGAWSEMAVRAFLLVNLAAYLDIFFRLLRRRGWGWFAAAAAVLLCAAIAPAAYVNGYADNHYALPLMLAALALVGGAGRADGVSPAVAVLLAGFAVNVKNEALLFCLAGLAVWALLRAPWRRPRADDAWRAGVARALTGSRARSCLAPALLGAAPVLLWAGFKARYGITDVLQPARALQDPCGAGRQCLARLPEILRTIGGMHVAKMTPLLLMVALLLLLFRVRAGREGRATGPLLRRPEVCLLGWFAAIHALLGVIFGLTPFDPTWHLGTALDRLLMLPMLLVAGLIILLAEALVVGEGTSVRRGFSHT
jgi:hypothetical protein